LSADGVVGFLYQLYTEHNHARDSTLNTTLLFPSFASYRRAAAIMDVEVVIEASASSSTGLDDATILNDPYHSLMLHNIL